jgi:hydroxyethylthiazole kinase-like uncharacterized protein yjeF
VSHWPRRASAQVLDRLGVRRLDEATIARGVAGVDLMETAGEAIAAVLDSLTGRSAGPRLSAAAECRRLVVAAGTGNNAGDGFVVARLLAEAGWDCRVVLACGAVREGGEAFTNLQRWRSRGGRIEEGPAALARALEAPPGDLLVLDALLGTGLDRAVDGLAAEVIGILNSSGHAIVAADIPSGLCADRGLPLGIAVEADLTISIGAAKPGLFVGSGPDHSGRVVVVDIGLDDPADHDIPVVGRVLDAASCADYWQPRRPMLHKGSAGHVLVVGASPGRTGAVLLAARAALRTGAGLVTMAVPAPLASATDAALAEAMTLALPADDSGHLTSASLASLLDQLATIDAVVLGPGLGSGAGPAAFAQALLEAWGGPLLVDADGLNVLAPVGNRLATVLDQRRRNGAQPTVFTPHPGEMGRLLQRDSAAVQADRRGAVEDFLAATGDAVVVLKGAGSLVAAQGAVAYNTSGNPGMAAPGMGDVLAGIGGALLAAGRPPWDAAAAAVHVHGMAADLLYADTDMGGLLASDVADAVAAAMALLGGARFGLGA